MIGPQRQPTTRRQTMNAANRALSRRQTLGTLLALGAT